MICTIGASYRTALGSFEGYRVIGLLFLLFSCSGNKSKELGPDNLQVVSIFTGDVELHTGSNNIPISTQPEILVSFNLPVLSSELEGAVTLIDSSSGSKVDLALSVSGDGSIVSIEPYVDLSYNTAYLLIIGSNLIGRDGQLYEGLELSFVTVSNQLFLKEITIDGQYLNNSSRVMNVDRQPEIFLKFSRKVSPTKLWEKILLTQIRGSSTEIEISTQDSVSFAIEPLQPLSFLTGYKINLTDQLRSVDNSSFEATSVYFFTKVDSTFKFPEVSNDDLLTIVQEQTFKYFWDYGHPVSGLTRERNNAYNTSGEIITIGGSGFGLMAIIVGIERGFVSRDEGIDRLERIIYFLRDNVTRYHGIWPHWLNGTTGTVIPFWGERDNGADLSESSYMMVGLLTVRQYLRESDPKENALIEQINNFWKEAEWHWFTKNGSEHVLYWHWSPDFEWQINLPMTGYNETLITYILAASSPTFPISPEVYDQGFARNGTMVSNQTYYGIQLPLHNIPGNYGGPLFFSHYSFLGLDPRNLSDQYANYWDQGVKHTLINRAYCIDNPKEFVGYSHAMW